MFIIRVARHYSCRCLVIDTFLGCFDPILDCLGAPLGPKRPSNDPFWDQKGVKMAENVTLDHLGCSNTHSEPDLRLFVAILKLHLAPNPLEKPQ